MDRRLLYMYLRHTMLHTYHVDLNRRICVLTELSTCSYADYGDMKNLLSHTPLTCREWKE